MKCFRGFPSVSNLHNPTMYNYTSQDKKKGAFQDCHCLTLEWKKFVPAETCVQGPVLDLHLQEQSGRGHGFRFHNPNTKKSRRRRRRRVQVPSPVCFNTESLAHPIPRPHAPPEGVEDAHTQHGGVCERLSAGLSGPIQSSQLKTLGFRKNLTMEL